MDFGDLSQLEAAEELIDHDQVAYEKWMEQRAGKFTCSKFGDLMKVGRSSEWSQVAISYIHMVVAERLGSWHSFTSSATRWGNEFETKAVEAYQQRTSNDVHDGHYQFFEYNEYCGGTPDRLVGTDGTLEVKCPHNPSVHINTLVTQTVPKEYEWQVHGHLLVTGRKWCDFVSFDPRQNKLLSSRLAVIRVERDEEKIERLKKRIDDAEKVAQRILEAIT